MKSRTILLWLALYLAALYILPDECPECGSRSINVAGNP